METDSCPYKAVVTRKRDGETAEVNPEYLQGLEDKLDILFMWTEGNFGCDCNRSIFFNEGHRVGVDDSPEGFCGTDEFDVKLFFNDGSVVNIVGDEIEKEG